MHVVRIASWLDDPWLFAIFIGLFVRAQYELLFSLSILVVFPTSPIVLPIRQFVYPICLSFQSLHLSSQSSLLYCLFPLAKSTLWRDTGSLFHL